ncbi:MAG: GNAT family N-acetyltransferase [Methanomassiliicoccales archaeon]|nr:GNAT family N-acetyltransferase [Methanomassiliicoccales archaeon]
MEISLRPMRTEDRLPVVRMITDFYNFHRRLTSSSQSYMQTDQDSLSCLEEWEGRDHEVLCIWCEHRLAGFLALRYGGHRAAWLEELYVLPEFRGRSTGSKALKRLDEMMMEKDILAMFVDVIPRNEEALRFYLDQGFDHLNMLQLRKNYDHSLDKEEEIEVLGHRMRKY